MVFDPPADSAAGDGRELRDGREPDAARSGAGDDRRGKRVLTDLLEARGQAKQRRLLDARNSHDGDERRLALSESARLVHDQRRDALEGLQSLGVANQHAKLGAAARADHDRHWRRQAKRARASDDQDGNGVHERIGKARLGTHSRPDDERHDGHRDDRWHEPPRHCIGEPLNWRPRSLRIVDHAHDAREQRVAPDALCFEHECPGAVDGAAGDRRTRRLLDGMGSPVIMDSSTGAPSRTTPSTGTCSPGRTRADRGCGARRDIVFGPSASTLRAVFGRPSVANRRTRQLRARSSSTPEQHEHDNDRGGLEMGRNLAVPRAGETTRRDRREHAVGERCFDAIAMSVNVFRCPLATDAMPREEWPSAHTTTGVARRELDPLQRAATRDGAAADRATLGHHERE
jgi:hypothetical protein